MTSATTSGVTAANASANLINTLIVSQMEKLARQSDADYIYIYIYIYTYIYTYTYIYSYIYIYDIIVVLPCHHGGPTLCFKWES